jgi:hypothetical protein
VGCACRVTCEVGEVGWGETPFGRATTYYSHHLPRRPTTATDYSHHLRFCTPSCPAAAFRSSMPSGAFCMSETNFLVSKPRLLSYRHVFCFGIACHARGQRA